MRNLGLVFFFIVAELFLQGCDPIANYSISIKSKEQPSVKMDNRKLEIIEVVESILRQHEFTPTPRKIENVLLSMHKDTKGSKHTKRTLIDIFMYSEDNIIIIHTMEWGTFRMSDFALRLQNEIADKLNQLFKDCCIIIKDNECFEDSK